MAGDPLANVAAENGDTGKRGHYTNSASPSPVMAVYPREWQRPGDTNLLAFRQSLQI